jgi:hypothetical protein
MCGTGGGIDEAGVEDDVVVAGVGGVDLGVSSWSVRA